MLKEENREKLGLFLKHLDDGELYNINGNLNIVKNFLRFIVDNDILLEDMFENKQLYDYFGFEDDIFRVIDNKYKFYMLNVKITKSGNLYFKRGNRFFFINLKNKMDRQRCEENLNIVVLLNNQSIKYKDRTHHLDDERITVINDEDKKIKDFFENPYFKIKPFQNKEKVILAYHYYDKIDDILEKNTEEDLKSVFDFSIFEEEVFNYDKFLFDEDLMDENYLPLLYECYIQFDNKNQLRKMFEILKQNNGYISVKLSFDKNDEYKIKGKVYYSCGVEWFETVYIQLCEEQINNGYLEKINQLYKLIPILNNMNSISSLNRLNDFVPKILNIYNIGHGECSICQLENDTEKLNIFFDFGSTCKKEMHYQKAVKEIKDSRVDMLILSHWHVDHLRIFSHRLNINQNCIFVLPDLNLFHTRSAFLKRILKKLCNNYASTLYIVKNIVRTEILHTPYLLVTTGEHIQTNGKGYSNTEMNNFGLVSVLDYNHKNVLIPGDCDYSVMHNDVRQAKYNLLIVSHHGGNLSKAPEGKKDSDFVICCSQAYGNPKDKTLNTWYKQNYKNGIIFKDIKKSKYTFKF